MTVVNSSMLTIPGGRYKAYMSRGKHFQHNPKSTSVTSRFGASFDISSWETEILLGLFDYSSDADHLFRSLKRCVRPWLRRLWAKYFRLESGVYHVIIAANGLLGMTLKLAKTERLLTNWLISGKNALSNEIWKPNYNYKRLILKITSVTVFKAYAHWY